jgi:UDP-N-acetylglucosamine:LPS N-acetylglucosamine transferase
VVLADSAATTASVAEQISLLISDDAALETMSKAALHLSRPDAALRLAALVREVAA